MRTCTRVKYSMNVYTYNTDNTAEVGQRMKGTNERYTYVHVPICILEYNTYVQGMSHTTYIGTLYDT